MLRKRKKFVRSSVEERMKSIFREERNSQGGGGDGSCAVHVRISFVFGRSRNLRNFCQLLRQRECERRTRGNQTLKKFVSTICLFVYLPPSLDLPFLRVILSRCPKTFTKMASYVMTVNQHQASSRQIGNVGAVILRGFSDFVHEKETRETTTSEILGVEGRGLR